MTFDVLFWLLSVGLIVWAGAHLVYPAWFRVLYTHTRMAYKRDPDSKYVRNVTWFMALMDLLMALVVIRSLLSPHVQ